MITNTYFCRGVCPTESKCCIHLRGSRPSPGLVADNNPFSTFFSSASTDDNTAVADNSVINDDNDIIFAPPETFNAFDVLPSLSSAAGDNQNQNFGYLGGMGGRGRGAEVEAGVGAEVGTQQQHQQPEVIRAAPIAGDGFWS